MDYILFSIFSGEKRIPGKLRELEAWHLGQCSLRSLKSPLWNCNINREANHLISCCSSRLNQNLLLFTGKHLTSSPRTFQGGDVAGIEFLKFTHWPVLVTSLVICFIFHAFFHDSFGCLWGQLFLLTRPLLLRACFKVGLPSVGAGICCAVLNTENRLLLHLRP